MKRLAALMLLFTLALALSAAAQEEFVTEEVKIVKARNLSEANIAVYIQDIESIDVKTGSYELDFWVGLKCEELCVLDDFNIVNGRIQYSSPPADLNGVIIYRIQARFSSPIDLHNYPFDEQNLTIIIEPREARIGSPKVKVLTGLTGIDDRMFLPGWEIEGFSVSENIIDLNI